MSQQIIPFMRKVGDELEQRGHEVLYIPQNEPLTIRDCTDEFEDVSIFLRHIDSSPQSSFEELLEKFGISSPRSLVFPQMVYDYNYSAVNHQPFITGSRGLNYEPYFDLLHQTLDAFDKLFETGEGGIPIHRQGGEVLRRALQRVADTYDEQSVWVGFSPLDGHSSLYSDESVTWTTFESSHEVQMDDSDRQRARKFIDRVRTRQQVFTHDIEEIESEERSIARRNLGRIKRLTAPRNESRRNKVARLGSKVARQLGKRAKSRIVQHLYYYDEEQSRRIIEHERFVFLPLQYFRESRVTVRAPAFYDIAWLVEYVSRSLPSGCELVVKDHPAQMGSLPISTIRAISRHSKAIHPSINAHQVVNNAEGVITLNNTVGYESIIQGKPVMTLGSSFYDEEDVVVKVGEINGLQHAIRDLVAMNDLSREEVERFAYRILKGSYRGQWNVNQSENVVDIVDSLELYLESS